MEHPNYFCDSCGAQMLTETFQVRNQDSPGELITITQGRCIVCNRVMSFAG